jgi:polyhydroxyalkanoate synthase
MQLDAIKTPTFVTGAVVDHLTPGWAVYRTTQLLGGEATFVLSYSGHIASLVNPPGNPKAHYWTGSAPGPIRRSGSPRPTKQQGTLVESLDRVVPAPRRRHEEGAALLGNKAHPVVDPAPGRYVRS